MILCSSTIILLYLLTYRISMYVYNIYLAIILSSSTYYDTASTYDITNMSFIINCSDTSDMVVHVTTYDSQLLVV